MRLTSEMMSEIRTRINPNYKDVQGTESYERAALVEMIDVMRSEIACLKAELDNYKSIALLVGASNADRRNVGGKNE